MRIFLPILSDRKPVTSCSTPQIPGCIAFKNPISFVLKPNEDKNQIISEITEVKKYYSDNGNLVTLRFADADTEIDIVTEDNEFRKVEEIVEKYYSEFFTEDILEKIEKSQDGSETTNISYTSSPEEYPQKASNNNILQDFQSNNITNDNLGRGSLNNLLYDKKEYKLIYCCYYCKFETDVQQEYEKHCVLAHPNKPAYPSLIDIQEDGLKPQGKRWE